MTVVGATFGTAGLAAGITGVTIGGAATGDTASIAATNLAAVVFTILAGLLGLGIGMVAKHTTAAVSGLLVWWLVVENLLSVVLDPAVSRFLPFVAGNGLIGIGPEDPDALAAALTRTQNGLVLGTYTLLTLVIGAVLLHRRDPA